MNSTVECGPGHADGRRRKMEIFVDAIDTLMLLESPDNPDVTDAVVSLRVTAGIVAADVICCTRLGGHSTSTNHGDAVALLKPVDATLANHLRRLLQMKPKAQYGALAVSARELKTSARAVEVLVAAARDR